MAEIVTREAAQARLVEKAAADPQFRAALVADPKKAIANEFGMAIPPNVAIEVLEETPAHYYVVLPPTAGAAEGEELDDEELGAVAGGGSSALDGSNAQHTDAK